MKVKRPSIRLLAKEAGVSVSTISRYLRRELDIRSETEEKILNAARDLGYALPPKTTLQLRRIIGVVVPNLSNLFYATLVDAMVQAAHLAGYRVVVESTHDSPQRQMDYITSLQEYPVDGILYCGHTAKNDVLKHYVETGGHVVLIDEDVPDIAGVSRIFVNNYDGMSQQVRYLLQCGHRRIGYIGGPQGLMTADQRLWGYLDEMKAWDIVVGPSLIVSGEFSRETGHQGANQLLSQSITAIVAADDMVAVGVLQYCHTHHIPVPETLSLVGFDDIAVAQLLMPPLTTVHQPVEEIGRRALETMILQLEDPTFQPTTIMLPVSLVVRQSVSTYSNTTTHQ